MNTVSGAHNAEGNISPLKGARERFLEIHELTFQVTGFIFMRGK